MSCKPKPRNALLIHKHRMTAWSPQSIVEVLLQLSQQCLSTLAFGICGASRKKQQTVLWRWKSRPAQVFQIKALMSSSTKMHGANTGVGSNTFCGSGVVLVYRLLS